MQANNLEKILNFLEVNNPKYTNINLTEIELNYNQLVELHSVVGKNRIAGHIKWGAIPQDRNSLNLKDEIEAKIIENNKNYKPFPTDYIYALLSNHAYLNSNIGEKIKFSDEKYNTHHIADWEIHKVYDHNSEDGFYGVIYVNRQTYQVVLSFRGSEFTDVREQMGSQKETDYTTDFRGILGGKVVSQLARVFKATKEAVEYAKSKGYTFSTTGHSLGGWLAEVSAFLCHLEFEYTKVRTVTFDSPGSLSTWEVLQSNNHKHANSFNPKNIDIVCYVNPPNLVNTCNKHIGKINRLFPDLGYAEWLNKIKFGHRIEYEYYNSTTIFEELQSAFNEYLTTYREYKLTSVLQFLDYASADAQPYFEQQPADESLSSSVISEFYKSIKEYIFNFNEYEPLSDFGYNPQLHGKFTQPIEHEPYSSSTVSEWVQFIVGKYLTGSYKLRATPSFEPLSLKDEAGKLLYYIYSYLPFVAQDTIYHASKTFYPNCGHLLESAILPQFNADTGVPDNYMLMSDWPYIERTPSEMPPETIEFIRNKFVARPKEIAAISTLFTDNMNSVSALIEVLDNTLMYRYNPQQYWHAYRYLDPENKYNSTLVISSEDEFYKYFKGHFKEAKPGVENNLYYNLPHDSYLIDLWRNKEHLLNSPLLTDFNKSQLLAVTSLYNIKSNDISCSLRNKKCYIELIEGTDISLAQLKNYIMRLAEVIPKEELEKIINSKEGHKYRNIDLYSNIEKQTNNLVRREDEIRRIKEAFSEGKDVIITGIYGIGKKTLALKYGNEAKSNGTIVRWFEAGKEDKLNLWFNQLAKDLGIMDPQDLRKRGMLVNEINRKLNNLIHNGGKKLLFIFDNYEEESSINFKDEHENYIDMLPSEVNILVTTTKHELDNINKREFKMVELKVLSREEVYNLLMEQIHYIEPWEAYKLIKLIDGIAIPERLSLVIKEIQEGFITVDKYILNYNEIKSKGNIVDPITEMILKDIVKQESSWELLKYFAYLDFEYIPLSMFEGWLAANPDDLNRIIKPTARLMVKSAKHKTGVTIHKVIQEEVKTYLKATKGIEGIAETVKSLAERINELLPQVEENPDSGWQAAEELSVNARHLTEECEKLGIASPAIASIMNKLANYYGVVVNDYKEELAFSEKSLKMRQELYNGRDHQEIAESLAGLGGAHDALGDRDGSLRYYQDSLVMNKRLYNDQDHIEIAKSLNQVGRIYSKLNKFAPAESCLLESLAMMKRIYNDEDHYDKTAPLNNLGLVYLEDEKYPEARDCFERALNMTIRLYPEQHHFKTAVYNNNLGTLYYLQSNWDLALDYFEKALKVHKDLYGETHPSVAITMSNIGSIYFKQKNTDKALEYYKEVLKTEVDLYGDKHPSIAISLNNIGRVHQKSGDLKEAFDYLQKALEIQKSYFGDDAHSDIVFTLTNLGRVYKGLKNYEEELNHYTQAWEMLKTLSENKDTSQIVKILKKISYAYKHLSNEEEALKYEQQALEMEQRLADKKAEFEKEEAELVSVEGLEKLLKQDNTEEAEAVDITTKSENIYTTDSADEQHTSTQIEAEPLHTHEEL